MRNYSQLEMQKIRKIALEIARFGIRGKHREGKKEKEREGKRNRSKVRVNEREKRK